MIAVLIGDRTARSSRAANDCSKKSIAINVLATRRCDGGSVIVAGLRV